MSSMCGEYDLLLSVHVVDISNWLFMRMWRRSGHTLCEHTTGKLRRGMDQHTNGGRVGYRTNCTL